MYFFDTGLMSYISFCSCVYVKSVCPKVGWQGDQIGQFLPVGLHLERWRSPKKWHHFDLNRQIQNMGCCRYFILLFQNWFDVDILHFQIKIWYKYCRYFGIFLHWDCFGYFLQNWAIFSNLLITLFNGQKLTIFVLSVLLSKCQLF